MATSECQSSPEADEDVQKDIPKKELERLPNNDCIDENNEALDNFQAKNLMKLVYKIKDLVLRSSRGS